MDGIVSRLALTGTLLLLVAALGACSGSPPSASHVSSTGTGAGSSALSSTGTATASGSPTPSGTPHRGSGHLRPPAPPAPPAPPGRTGPQAPPTVDLAPTGHATAPSKSMPVINPPAIGGIGYAPASQLGRTRLAPVHMASADLLVSYSVSTLTVLGRDVGAVGVYRTKSGMTRSTIFQQQYVVQLINAVTSQKTTPRIVQVDGSVMALSTGPIAVAGWFKGDQVVLVYRHATSPDLAALATGVRATPPPA